MSKWRYGDDNNVSFFAAKCNAKKTCLICLFVFVGQMENTKEMFHLLFPVFTSIAIKKILTKDNNQVKNLGYDR